MSDQGIPPCIIVIDTLDECEEENTTSRLTLDVALFD